MPIVDQTITQLETVPIRSEVSDEIEYRKKVETFLILLSLFSKDIASLVNQLQTFEKYTQDLELTVRDAEETTLKSKTDAEELYSKANSLSSHVEEIINSFTGQLPEGSINDNLISESSTYSSKKISSIFNMFGKTTTLTSPTTISNKFLHNLIIADGITVTVEGLLEEESKFVEVLSITQLV